MNIRNSLALVASITVLIIASPAIAASVVGSTTAKFINPTPGSVTTGVGTSTFTTGIGSGTPPNTLKFTGTAFSSALETPFKVGSLYYYNGSTNSAADSVDLSLSMLFTMPALPTVTSVFDFGLVSTPNVGTPNQQADYLYFPSSYSSTSFVIGATTYTVKLTGFANIVGDGFLNSDTTQLHVRENESATADLFAIVTSQTAPGSTLPEPATWAMTLVGLGMIGYAMRGRNSHRMVTFA